MLVVVCLFGSLVGWLAGWRAGWLVGWLVGVVEVEVGFGVELK